MREGSPPRVRGKLVSDGVPGRRLRITPACAGKTRPQRSVARSAEDHPRVCGENLKREKTVDLTRGSPPRVRGKQGGKRIRKAEERITPACAGKTVCLPVLSHKLQDHPRVCGENAQILIFPVHFGGSPPRVRGKPTKAKVLILHFGITPACAGKTLDCD